MRTAVVRRIPQPWSAPPRDPPAPSIFQRPESAKPWLSWSALARALAMVSVRLTAFFPKAMGTVLIGVRANSADLPSRNETASAAPRPLSAGGMAALPAVESVPASAWPLGRDKWYPNRPNAVSSRSGLHHFHRCRASRNAPHVHLPDRVENATPRYSKIRPAASRNRSSPAPATTKKSHENFACAVHNGFPRKNPVATQHHSAPGIPRPIRRIDSHSAHFSGGRASRSSNAPAKTDPRPPVFHRLGESDTTGPKKTTSRPLPERNPPPSLPGRPPF